MERQRFLGMRIGPLTARRLANFRANRRGFWSLWVFLALFIASLFAEFIANDRPIVVFYDGNLFAPIFTAYPETAFGGEFATEADYRDPIVVALINEKGWMIQPLVPYNHRTVAWDLRRRGQARRRTLRRGGPRLRWGRDERVPLRGRVRSRP